MEEALKRYVAEEIAARYGLNNREVKRCLDSKTRGRPKSEKRVVSLIRGEAVIARLISEAKIENRQEEEEEEEIEVKRFNYKEQVYLKSSDNKIYSNTTHEEIGVWNEFNREIEFD